MPVIEPIVTVAFELVSVIVSARAAPPAPKTSTSVAAAAPARHSQRVLPDVLHIFCLPFVSLFPCHNIAVNACSAIALPRPPRDMCGTRRENGPETPLKLPVSEGVIESLPAGYLVVAGP